VTAATSRRRRERVLVVGASPLARQLMDALKADPAHWELLGVVDDPPAAEGLNGAYLGSLGELGRILHEQRPDRIAIALATRRGRLPLSLLLKSRLRGILVDDGVELYVQVAGKIAIETLHPSAVIFSKEYRRPASEQRLNRLLSIVFASVSLVLLLPLLALIAALIAWESPGPVLFTHPRVGKNGRHFRLLKFRTMKVGAAASEWERDNDHRITRVGRILRRFRLDELPQFVNILRGDMNLVGPRPHPVSNFALFRRHIPYYWIRSTVLPGVTGWAQIRYGYANGIDEETEKMRYDLYYIKHMSLGLDLRVLLETLTVVLFGRDASSARARPLSAAPATVPPETLVDASPARTAEPVEAEVGP
jgi:exopolysaccharide biosynthesis polyprenyl glycosylphosphotransferase